MAEGISYIKLRDDFFSNYQKKLAPSIEKFKKERNLKLKFLLITKLILLLISLCLIILTVINYSKSIGFLIVLVGSCVLCIILAFMFESVLKKNIDISLKKKVLPSTCLFLGDLTWIDGKGDSYVNNNVLKRSLILSDYNECKYEDSFVTKNMDIKLDIVELNLLRSIESKKYLIFDGIIVKYDLNKNFKSHTILCINSDNKLKKNLSTKLNQINIENGVLKEFEELNIDVFSNNNQDAQNLMSASFIHNINNIKLAFNAKQLSCAIFENSLIVVIPTNKKIFSLEEIINSTNNSKYFFNFYEKITSTYKFMEYFKLNH